MWSTIYSMCVYLYIYLCLYGYVCVCVFGNFNHVINLYTNLGVVSMISKSKL
jgi:hypothetical protein